MTLNFSQQRNTPQLLIILYFVLHVFFTDREVFIRGPSVTVGTSLLKVEVNGLQYAGKDFLLGYEKGTFLCMGVSLDLIKLTILSF